MKPLLTLATLAAVIALSTDEPACAQRAEYNELVAKHAHANAVPEALVHRVILRESRYQPGLVGRGGTIGLMQIKLATARGLGYTGTAEGLRDPERYLSFARDVEESKRALLDLLIQLRRAQRGHRCKTGEEERTLHGMSPLRDAGRAGD